MSSKRINPRHRPANHADIERAADHARVEAVNYAIAIIFTVLCDKFGGDKYLSDIWREVNKLSDEISEGRINVTDLINTLKEDYGICLVN